MKSNFKYPVVLVKRIPYFTKLLGSIVSVCFVICAVAWFIYFPSADSGNEMKAVALMEGTSEPTKWIIIFSGIGLAPLYFLFVKLRIRKPGFLLFNDDNIVLQTKEFIKVVPILNIHRIQFSEPNLYSKLWRPKFIVIIQLYDTENLRLRVKHYEHADEIVDSFLNYQELTSRIKEGPDNMFESDIVE